MRVAVLSATSPALDDAVAAQARPPGPDEGRADWLWVLDGTALPDPGALAALLDAAERLADVSPALLSSAVLGDDGAVHPAHVPLLPQGHPDVAIETVARQVAHVRATSAASVLVRPESVAGGLPRDAADGFAWTARLLRDAQGFVVPQSTARAVGGAPPGRAIAALLADGRLRGRERARLAVDALTSARRHAPHAR